VRLAAAAVVLAACGNPAAKPEPPPPAITPTSEAPVENELAPPAAVPPPRWDGTGCPGADAVIEARWAGGTTWRLPIGRRTPSDPTHPEPGPLDAADLPTYELTAAPETQWIFRAGADPCPGRVTGYEVELLNEMLEGDRELTSFAVFATVTACDPGSAPGTAWAVSGPEQLDSTCAVVAAATDEWNAFVEDSSPQLKLKARRESVPGRYHSLRPKASCKSPCATEWTIEELPTVPAISQVKITRTSVDRRKDVCEWDTSARFGTFVRDGKAWRELPGAPVMKLVGAFVDGKETKLLLYVDPGEWSVVPVDGSERVYTRYYEHDYGTCEVWWCCCAC
jgi:hypothetical protein